MFLLGKCDASAGRVARSKPMKKSPPDRILARKILITEVEKLFLRHTPFLHVRIFPSFFFIDRECDARA
jgi:hypothetical protein